MGTPWFLRFFTRALNTAPRWYQLSASAESDSCSPGVWTTLRFMSLIAQTHQISLAQAWMTALRPLPAWKIATAVALSLCSTTFCAVSQGVQRLSPTIVLIVLLYHTLIFHFKNYYATWSLIKTYCIQMKVNCIIPSHNLQLLVKCSIKYSLNQSELIKTVGINKSVTSVQIQNQTRVMMYPARMVPHASRHVLGISVSVTLGGREQTVIKVCTVTKYISRCKHTIAIHFYNYW